MKLRMPNGDVISVREGFSPEQAIDEWAESIYKEHGYNPEEGTPEAIEARQQATMDAAGQDWAEQNPIEGRVASYQAGARNLGRGLAQMALPQALEARFGVSDEDIKEDTAVEDPLKEAYPGAYLSGEIIPTFAVPTGRAAATVKKGGETAYQVLKEAARRYATTGVGRASAEGAVYGAATASPEHRVAGGAVGALGGAAGNVLPRSLSRLGTGVAPRTGQATRAVDEIKRMGGEEPFIPLNLAAGKTGPGAVTRWAYDAVVPLNATASRKLTKQGEEFGEAGMSAMLRGSYGKKLGNEVADVLRTTGRLDDATLSGNRRIVSAGPTRRGDQRDVLTAAAARADEGTPTFGQIARTSGRMFPGEGSKAPLRQIADDLNALFKKSGGEPGVAQRAGFYEVMQNTFGKLAYFTGLPLLASKPVQNFLMGNVQWQKALLSAINSGRERGINQVLGKIVREAGISGTFEAEEAVEETIDGKTRQLLEESMNGS